MSPVLFYGVPEGCSFGSIVALEWSGQPYRLCRVEMPSQVTSEAFLHINKVAETPSLLTADGRLLSQSVAILHHIGAHSRDPGLVPRQGTPAFDRFNEMLAFLNTNFFESFAPLWYAMEHGAAGAQKDALTSMGRHKVRKSHEDLEKLLGSAAWLGGEQRTAADAYFLGIARWNDFHKVLDRRDYPRLEALHSRLWADPAVRFAHAIEHEEAATSAGGWQGHVTLDEMVVAVAQAA
jgi:glutathione S-transferase